MFVLTVRVNYWLILCVLNFFLFCCSLAAVVHAIFLNNFCQSTMAKWRSRHIIVVATLGPKWVEL